MFIRFVCFVFVGALLTMTAATAHAGAAHITLRADSPTTCVIRPVWTKTNNWDISSLVNERRTTAIREIILMTATGGRPTNNMATLTPEGKLECDFTSLTLALDHVLDAGLEPEIVIGNTPDCLTTTPKTGGFSVNTQPPAREDLYSEYITKLFACLVDRYGRVRVMNWKFRLMTEPDNTSWWTGDGIKGYERLYDLTVAAARRALPEILINGGNYMTVGKQPDSVTWQEDWPARVALNTSDTTGALPRRIDTISFSCYGTLTEEHPTQLGTDPRYLKNIMDDVRRATEKYITTPLRYSIAEGQLLFDENNKYLWLGDGTEKGAAWNAAMIKLAHDTGLDRNVQWGWAGLADGNLRSPVYHVIQMFEHMLDSNLLSVDVKTRDTTPSLYIDAIGAIDENDTLRVVVFSYDWTTRETTPTTEVTLDINGHNNQKYAVTHYRVDRDHSNFMTRWLEDSKDIKRVDKGSNSGSIWDLDIVHTLDDAGIALWRQNVPLYKTLDSLQDCEPPREEQMKNGKLTLRFNLPPNSVSQFVLRKLD